MSLKSIQNVNQFEKDKLCFSWRYFNRYMYEVPYNESLTEFSERCEKLYTAEQNEIFENIIDDSLFFLDIEKTFNEENVENEKQSLKILKTAIKNIETVMKTNFCKDSKILISASNGKVNDEFKYSYHVILQNYIFNRESSKAFFDLVVELAPLKHQSWYDGGVYNKNRLLRCLYQNKPFQKRPFYPIDINGKILHKTFEKESFIKYLVTNIHHDSFERIHIRDEKLKNENMKCKIEKNKKHESEKKFDDNDLILTEAQKNLIQKALNIEAPGYILTGEKWKNTYQAKRKTIQTPCPIHNRIHESGGNDGRIQFFKKRETIFKNKKMVTINYTQAVLFCWRNKGEGLKEYINLCVFQ